MDDRTEIFEFLCEVDKACDRPIDIEDIETRGIRNRLFNLWRREVHCLGLGQDAPIADVHEQAELAKMIEEITGAGDKVRSSVEEKSTIVSEERKPELKGCCTTLALRLLTHGDTIRTRAKLGLRHWPIHRLHRRLHDEQK